MTREDFLNRLAALGYSQEQFALALGASLRTVQGWGTARQGFPRPARSYLALLEEHRQLQRALAEASQAAAVSRETKNPASSCPDTGFRRPTAWPW